MTLWRYTNLFIIIIIITKFVGYQQDVPIYSLNTGTLFFLFHDLDFDARVV